MSYQNQWARCQVHSILPELLANAVQLPYLAAQLLWVGWLAIAARTLPDNQQIQHSGDH